MRLNRFPQISWVRGQTACAAVCKRDAARGTCEESFTRSQLAGISSIHRFIGSGGWTGWAGWLAGLLVGWLAAGCWLEEDDEEEGFQGCLARSTLRRVRRICKQAGLKRIWTMVGSYFFDFVEISRDFMVFRSRRLH